MLMLVAFLFAFLAHEDLRQTDRLEQPLVIKAERAGNSEQVESIELVFDTERAKLTSERHTWLWVAAGSGAAAVVGLGMAWAASRPRR